jgi:hypothetical protein
MMLFLRQSEALSVVLRVAGGFLIYVLTGVASRVIDLREVRSLMPGTAGLRGNL